MHRTALTVSAEAQRSAARMVPRTDSSMLFGVSCNGLLDGAGSELAQHTSVRAHSVCLEAAEADRKG